MMDSEGWAPVARELSAKAGRDNPGVTIRHGRVLSVGAEGAHITVGLHVAGDPEGVTTFATSTLGDLRLGEWVMVFFAPPRGTYVIGRVLTQDVICQPLQIMMVHHGLLVTGPLTPWRSDQIRSLVRVDALLGTAGSTGTDLTVFRDGVAIATLNMAAGAIVAAETTNDPFYAFDTRLTVNITTAGTGASDLTMIFYFECGIAPVMDEEIIES